MDRRRFLKRAAIGTGLGLTGFFPYKALASNPELTYITILHTNDLHSRIEAFPPGSGENSGRGGFARRSSMVNQIRSENEHVLLLDAGDILQGTPYFNMFGGEIEFKLMTKMGYDAATIGNHEFDAGIDGLLKQWPHIGFPFVISNYDFSDTALAGKTKEHLIIKKGSVKIGILGLGIELEGLVPPALYGNTRYLDPLPIANEVAGRLKQDEGCDFVICLSHLGFKYETDKVSDVVVARNSSDIDLIIGGHTHTVLHEPAIEKNAKNESVLINQVGRNGTMLGRIDLLFEKNRPGQCIHCENLVVGNS